MVLNARGLGWQEHIKDGSAATAVRAATDANRASVLEDNSTADPKSKSGAILSFGGKEGLENSLAVLRGDARSRVSDYRPDARAPSSVPLA